MQYIIDNTPIVEAEFIMPTQIIVDNIAVVNLTEQEVERVKNCATISTMQQCFENFKEE